MDTTSTVALGPCRACKESHSESLRFFFATFVLFLLLVHSWTGRRGPWAEGVAGFLLALLDSSST